MKRLGPLACLALLACGSYPAQLDGGPAPGDAAARADGGTGPADAPLSDVPEERVYQAVALSDDRCQSAQDCTVFDVSASCTNACTSAALSRATGAPRAYEITASIELELCMNPGAVARIDPLHGRQGALCIHSDELVAHCIAGQCEATRPVCPSGCTPLVDGLCHGLAECDGCPAFPAELEGQPCAFANRRCDYRVHCGIERATCELGAGGLRWSVLVQLC